MSVEITHQWEVEETDDQLFSFTATFEITASVSDYSPARTNGPPEDCYPEEGGEVEILSINLIDFDAHQQTEHLPIDHKEQVQKLFQVELDKYSTTWKSVEEKILDQYVNGAYDYDS